MEKQRHLTQISTWLGLTPPHEPLQTNIPQDVLLDVQSVSVQFGGIIALDEVSLQVKHNQIHGLIGPNGAGKTTLFNCLSRLYTPNNGTMTFAGRSINKASPHHMAMLGIGRTFQNVALFPTMSVTDNVIIGAHTRARSGFLGGALRLPLSRREEKILHEQATEIINFLELSDVATRPVGDLPFGIRKRVELARALVSKPTLLMLDEPAGGLNHDDVDKLSDLILRLRDERNLTIFLVEHHMGCVMKTSDWVTAIDFGRKIGEGKPTDIQRNPEVIRAYLGGEVDGSA